MSTRSIPRAQVAPLVPSTEISQVVAFIKSFQQTVRNAVTNILEGVQIPKKTPTFKSPQVVSEREQIKSPQKKYPLAVSEADRLAILKSHFKNQGFQDANLLNHKPIHQDETTRITHRSEPINHSVFNEATHIKEVEKRMGILNNIQQANILRAYYVGHEKTTPFSDTELQKKEHFLDKTGFTAEQKYALWEMGAVGSVSRIHQEHLSSLSAKISASQEPIDIDEILGVSKTDEIVSAQ